MLQSGQCRQTWELKDRWGSNGLGWGGDTSFSFTPVNTSGPLHGGCQSFKVRRGSGALSALITLSGSKEGTRWVVIYRGWKGWTVVLATVLRTQTRLHFQTLTLSKYISILKYTSDRQIVHHTPSAQWVHLLSSAIDPAGSVDRTSASQFWRCHLLWATKQLISTNFVSSKVSFVYNKIY